MPIKTLLLSLFTLTLAAFPALANDKTISYDTPMIINVGDEATINYDANRTPIIRLTPNHSTVLVFPEGTQYEYIIGNRNLVTAASTSNRIILQPKTPDSFNTDITILLKDKTISIELTSEIYEKLWVNGKEKSSTTTHVGDTYTKKILYINP